MDLARAISRKKYTPPAGRVKLLDDDDDGDDAYDDDGDDDDEVTSNSREVSTKGGNKYRPIGRVITRAVVLQRLIIPILHRETTSVRIIKTAVRRKSLFLCLSRGSE